MTELPKTFEDMRHLCRYYNQAAHDFFSDLQEELQERLELLMKSVQENAGSPEQLREMVALLAQSQEQLKKRVEDLDFLTAQMLQKLSNPVKPR
jgi:hypothetical protein